MNYENQALRACLEVGKALTSTLELRNILDLIRMVAMHLGICRIYDIDSITFSSHDPGHGMLDGVCQFPGFLLTFPEITD
jgi:hypothetical protein